MNFNMVRGVMLVCILQLLMFQPTVSLADWTITTLETSKNFSNVYSRAIATEHTTGNPHIAYGGDHLYHAYHDGSKWHIETVDTSEDAGQYASIAVDAYNFVHIAYYSSGYLV